MAVIKSHKDLIVWQKAMQLALEIYRLTSLFPKEEKFGMVSQTRRAGVSIPSNIAKGFARNYKKEYQQFWAIAYGSVLELETQLILSKQLQFAHDKEFIKSEKLITEVLKMLNSMSRNYFTKSKS